MGDVSEEKRSSLMSSAMISIYLLINAFPQYFFGGKAANVPVEATAIGPQMRSAGVQFTWAGACQAAFDSYGKPDALFTGACFNHWGRFVPEGGPREFERFNWEGNVGPEAPLQRAEHLWLPARLPMMCNRGHAME